MQNEYNLRTQAAKLAFGLGSAQQVFANNKYCTTRAEAWLYASVHTHNCRHNLKHTTIFRALSQGNFLV